MISTLTFLNVSTLVLMIKFLRLTKLILLHYRNILSIATLVCCSHMTSFGAVIFKGYLLRHINTLVCSDVFSKIANLFQPKSYFTLHLLDPN